MDNNGNDKLKWYNKKWFMWVMLLICWPIGLYFLYRHRNEYSKNDIYKIVAVTFVIFAATQVWGHFNQPKETSKPAAQPQQTEQKSTKQTKITSFKYAEDAQKVIQSAIGKDASINIMDYWEMEHDNGTVDTKGTFDLQNKKHTFSARFGIDGHVPLMLHIDGKSIFFDEDKQDAIMDSHSKYQKQQ